MHWCSHWPGSLHEVTATGLRRDEREWEGVGGGGGGGRLGVGLGKSE